MMDFLYLSPDALNAIPPEHILAAITIDSSNVLTMTGTDMLLDLRSDKPDATLYNAVVGPLEVYGGNRVNIIAYVDGQFRHVILKETA